MNFLSLSKLTLPDTIVTDLGDPVLLGQEQRFTVNRVEFVKKLLKFCVDNKCGPWPFVKHYGFLLQRLGHFYTVLVPDELCQRVKTQWQFLQDIPEQPVIRLQIIHSGTLIPLHIDATRSVSLIYPVLNHTSAITNFYQSKKILPRGIVNPDECEFKESVIIDRYPVLLDVDQPHDVRYPKNSIPSHRPRISFNLKWSDMTFEQIRPYFESYS